MHRCLSCIILRSYSLSRCDACKFHCVTMLAANGKKNWEYTHTVCQFSQQMDFKQCNIILKISHWSLAFEMHILQSLQHCLPCAVLFVCIIEFNFVSNEFRNRMHVIRRCCDSTHFICATNGFNVIPCTKKYIFTTFFFRVAKERQREREIKA